MIRLWIRNALGQRELRDVAEMDDVIAPGLFQVCHMEDNGSLATDRMDFSLGNGNENGNLNARGWGLIIPRDGLEILYLTFGCRTRTDGNGAEVELVKNPDPNADGLFVGTGFSVVVPPNSYVATAVGSVTFNAGEALQFVTRNPGGSDVVVSAWGRWT